MYGRRAYPAHPRKKSGKITVKEITETAGVGRSTWFRHYSSQSEALSFKIQQLWYRWAQEHDLISRQFTLANAKSFFSFNYSIRGLLTTLYEYGQQSAVSDAFYQIMVTYYETNVPAYYQSSFFCYGLYGLLDAWIRRDFCEPPAEMARLLIHMTQNAGHSLPIPEF